MYSDLLIIIQCHVTLLYQGHYNIVHALQDCSFHLLSLHLLMSSLHTSFPERTVFSYGGIVDMIGEEKINFLYYGKLHSMVI